LELIKCYNSWELGQNKICKIILFDYHTFKHVTIKQDTGTAKKTWFDGVKDM